MDEHILSAISTVGFPIVVSCYLLVKFQATQKYPLSNRSRYKNILPA